MGRTKGKRKTVVSKSLLQSNHGSGGGPPRSPAERHPIAGGKRKKVKGGGFGLARVDDERILVGHTMKLRTCWCMIGKGLKWEGGVVAVPRRIKGSVCQFNEQGGETEARNQDWTSRKSRLDGAWSKACEGQFWRSSLKGAAINGGQRDTDQTEREKCERGGLSVAGMAAGVTLYKKKKGDEEE